VSSLSESVLSALILLFQFDPLLWSIVARSLWVSVLACAIACGLGMVLGAWLGVARFAGRDAVLTLLNTLLALRC
jgi:tungstate transport system permease protein